MRRALLIRFVLIAALACGSIGPLQAEAGCGCCERIAADAGRPDGDCCRVEPDRPHGIVRTARIGHGPAIQADPGTSQQAAGDPAPRVDASAGFLRSARDTYLRCSVLRI